MGLTSVIKPTLVNDLRFSYAYFRNYLDAPSQSDCEQISSGIPGACYGLGGVRLNFGSAGTFLFGNSVNVPQDRHQRTYQLTDNVNWTTGPTACASAGAMNLALATGPGIRITRDSSRLQPDHGSGLDPALRRASGQFENRRGRDDRRHPPTADDGHAEHWHRGPVATGAI